MGQQSDIKIIIDENSPNNRFVEEIKHRAEKKGIEILSCITSKITDTNPKLVYLSPQKGFIRPCPCSRKYRCCNYFTIDTVEGCIYDCEYCILKSFLNNSRILLKVDIDELVSELRRFKDITNSRDTKIRIGNGELSDSLALENLAPFSSILIEETRSADKLILEFKTKSNNVDEILNLPHNPRTTVSFSMTTNFLYNTLEKSTASPEERLLAAKRCVEHSYRIGFHFDPIIYYDEYESDYEDIIRRLTSLIPSEAISWISLGTIRFNPVMLTIFNSQILFNEYIIDAEHKMRYPLYTRKKIYRTIYDLLKSYIKGKVAIYLCMESNTLTKSILGVSFRTDEELNKYITQFAY